MASVVISASAEAVAADRVEKRWARLSVGDTFTVASSRMKAVPSGVLAPIRSSTSTMAVSPSMRSVASRRTTVAMGSPPMNTRGSRLRRSDIVSRANRSAA